jgi:hypothetical protein
VPYNRSRYQDKWRIERLARHVREQLGLDQFAVVDPWALADAIPAHIFYPEDLVPPRLAEAARTVDWDGGSFCLPGETALMVLLNPTRPKTRQSATLMEEFAHHLLNHQPTRLFVEPQTGLLRREFNQAQEHEAYDLGATILLPKELVQKEVNRGVSAIDLAKQHGCSPDLVAYRIRRCRLWNRHLLLSARSSRDMSAY